MSRRKRKPNKPPELPKYAAGVMAAGLERVEADRAIGLGPGLYTIEVQHDDWCRLLAGKGQCNCDPWVCKPKRVASPEEN